MSKVVLSEVLWVKADIAWNFSYKLLMYSTCWLRKMSVSVFTWMKSASLKMFETLYHNFSIHKRRDYFKRNHSQCEVSVSLKDFLLLECQAPLQCANVRFVAEQKKSLVSEPNSTIVFFSNCQICQNWQIWHFCVSV